MQREGVRRKSGTGVRIGCRHLRGDRPCLPHKKSGVHCDDCPSYEQLGERVLIIKLGAAGDVVRTTPILRKLRALMPSCHITWVSDYPEVLPPAVDVAVRMSGRISDWLLARQFDLALVLDKDPEAIGLGERVRAGKKVGFGMDPYGRCAPLDGRAEPKVLTGVFDDLSRANQKSYVEELFEMCGYQFEGERYVVDAMCGREFVIGQPRPLVGLNTGCGGRWLSRLWPAQYWAELAQSLDRSGLGVLLLGGEREHDANSDLAARTPADYLGHFSLEDFVGLVGQCDVLVTQVTMALHLAIGLEKRVVLMNNVFNSCEFELYGLGEIVEPPKPCGCYYAPQCPHDSMRKILPDAVAAAVSRQVEALGQPGVDAPEQRRAVVSAAGGSVLC